jgi:hypothetical protein
VPSRRIEMTSVHQYLGFAPIVPVHTSAPRYRTKSPLALLVAVALVAALAVLGKRAIAAWLQAPNGIVPPVAASADPEPLQLPRLHFVGNLPSTFGGAGRF